MVEACNASFQVHLQVDARASSRGIYNLAQVLAGAAAWRSSANSPIAVRPAAVGRDAHRAVPAGGRQPQPRTHLRETEAARQLRHPLGAQQSIARDLQGGHRALPRARRHRPRRGPDGRARRAARCPQLKALRLHNGTIYRWNRACYGITDGKPHLRIENRVMPAGPEHRSTRWPTPRSGRPDGRARRARSRTSPSASTSTRPARNFYTAAREGLGAHFTWLDGEEIAARELVLERLLPLRPRPACAARASTDADIATLPRRRRGARAQRRAPARAGSCTSLERRMQRPRHARRALNALVAATVQRQRTGRPVSEWERARLDEARRLEAQLPAGRAAT